MGRICILLSVIIGIVGFGSACSESRREAESSQSNGVDLVSGTRVLPTLYPTATQLPTALPTTTRSQQPTRIPATEIPFDQIVVDVRYAIPILGLDRRILGNVAGELELFDEAAGTSVILKNRAGVILEMQQALPGATIKELDEECGQCVYIEYTLPLTGQSGEGWLDDTQMLASLENYTALFLGPHFPAGTIIGLRREATPYEVAHSAAITDDGRLWLWTATESEVDAPQTAAIDLAQLDSNLGQVDWEELPTSFGQACFEGSGRESMLLDSPDGQTMIELICPELYLPGQLLPPYLALSTAASVKLDGSDLTPPELPLSVETLAAFLRDDGARLELSHDGRLNAIDGEGLRFTSTLTSSIVLSLTSQLLDSTLMQPGITALFNEDPGNVIVLRASDGLYEVAWSEPDEPLEALIRPWNELLESLLGSTSIEPLDEPQPTPEPTQTVDS